VIVIAVAAVDSSNVEGYCTTYVNQSVNLFVNNKQATLKGKSTVLTGHQGRKLSSHRCPI